MNELLERLRGAAEAYREATNVTEQREALAEILNAFADNAEAQGATRREHLYPVTELLSAIADIDEDTPNPLLQPNTKPGRHQRSRNRQVLGGQIAAAVTIEMNAGAESLNEACRIVAQRLKSIGISMPTGKVEVPLARSIRTLRDKVTSGERGDHTRNHYRVILRECKAISPREARENIYSLMARKNNHNPRC